jgi:uncharacterized protein (TIGR00369 family)
MNDEKIERTGVFWDIMEGKRPLPPVAQLLGFKLLDIDPEHGTIRAQFNAKPEFLNPVGQVQGGMLAAMLDDTLGPALVARLPPGHFAPTLELKTSFIAPAAVGKLICEGRVVHMGKSIAFLEGKLTDESGRLIATATATARIMSHPGA